MKTILVIYLAIGLAHSVRCLDSVWEMMIRFMRRDFERSGLMGLILDVVIVLVVVSLDIVIWPRSVIRQLAEMIGQKSNDNESTDKDEES